MVYEATKLLGEGAFGQVYEAKCSDHKTLVAVKIVRPTNQAERRLALEEVRINRLISHVAIVRFVEAWKELGCVYSVFELCSTNLSAYIDYLHSPSLRVEHRLTMFERVKPERVSLQLILALHYLHSDGARPKSILHRDLKPENILLGPSGDTKISDFGLACLVDKGQKAKLGIAGTPGFRSPEMLKGQQYGTATDIWSLGNVLWELFTGMPLHREMDAGSCKYNIRINVRSARNSFALRHAVEDMLSQKDFTRPGTCDILCDPKILEVLFQRWQPEGLRLESGGPPVESTALLSRVDKGHYETPIRMQRFETAVTTCVTEGSKLSQEDKRIKLG